MPRWIPVVVTQAQAEIIKQQVGAGLGARGIAKLNLPELEGLNYKRIHSVIRSSGLCNPRKVKGILAGQKQMTARKRRDIIAFLQEAGSTLTNVEVGVRFNVSHPTVGLLRKQLSFTADQRDNYAKNVQAERRKNKKSFHKKRRVKLFLTMCWKQKQMEAEGSAQSKRECPACGREWFATPDFYNFYKGKASDWCKICMSEKSRLMYEGLPWPKICAEIRRRFWVKAKFEKGTLESRQLSDLRHNKMKPCKGGCGDIFWDSPEFFHSVTKDGFTAVLDTCLECPI